MLGATTINSFVVLTESDFIRGALLDSELVNSNFLIGSIYSPPDFCSNIGGKLRRDILFSIYIIFKVN